MLEQAMATALNDQIKTELDSAYLYLSMAAYCEARNLPGFAHWLEVQWREELGHALKIYRYILDRGNRVALQALAQPPVDFTSPLQVFTQVQAHEERVTGSIHELMSLATEMKDYATQSFLQWFVAEQVEEEKTAAEVLAKVEMAGNEPQAILLLDRELASREG